MIRQSFIVTTYNQDSFIRKCLDSIVIDNPTFFEIIIGDDHSTDDTQKIILQYVRDYPDKIKYIRNTENLGIFRNLNNLLQYIKGDIVHFVAGDDYFNPGLCEEIVYFVRKEKILNYESPFVIITNTILLYPNGKERIWDNFRLKHRSMISESIRMGLSFRLVGISTSLLRKIPNIRTDIGYAADFIWGIDMILNNTKFYFSDKAFSVYRLGSGVTSSYNLHEMALSKLLALEILIKDYKSKLSKRDLQYVKFEMSKQVFILNSNFFTLVMYLCNIILNIFNLSINNPLRNQLKVLIPNKFFFQLKSLFYKFKG